LWPKAQEDLKEFKRAPRHFEYRTRIWGGGGGSWKNWKAMQRTRAFAANPRVLRRSGFMLVPERGARNHRAVYLFLASVFKFAQVKRAYHNVRGVGERQAARIASGQLWQSCKFCVLTCT
jgi:hypothetical protein